MIRRRAVWHGLMAAPVMRAFPAQAQSVPDRIQAGLAALEQAQGGRLGVCILDGANGRRIGRRMDERFALCSTFKLLAAAVVLGRVDRMQDRLDRRIVFSKDRLVPYSPETEKHAGAEGMTLGEICKAGLTLSDNTAGNLMLDTIGGPAAVTAFARSLGDEATRLDRMETALNEATPGDPRDTTTPGAMAGNLHRIVLGDVLSPQSRAQLQSWLVDNKTGGARLRAGLPGGWRVGDKTGAGDHATTNDIAVIWRPGGSTLVVTVYFAESPASVDTRNAVIADVGRLVATL